MQFTQFTQLLQSNNSPNYPIPPISPTRPIQQVHPYHPIHAILSSYPINPNPIHLAHPIYLIQPIHPIHSIHPLNPIHPILPYIYLYILPIYICQCFNQNDKTGIWTWLCLFYGFMITLVAFIWALPIFICVLKTFVWVNVLLQMLHFSFSNFMSNGLPVGWFVTLNIFILVQKL